MSKPNIAAVRDRPATERRLIHAVEKLLVRGGFGVLGPSAVAREAGVDKMLIYRYFGNLDGLVSAVGKFAPATLPRCAHCRCRSVRPPSRATTRVRLSSVL
jgi:AcrR family transcriptional regulator